MTATNADPPKRVLRIKVVWALELDPRVENDRAERVTCLNAGLIAVNMLIVGCSRCTRVDSVNEL